MNCKDLLIYSLCQTLEMAIENEVWEDVARCKSMIEQITIDPKHVDLEWIDRLAQGIRISKPESN